MTKPHANQPEIVQPAAPKQFKDNSNLAIGSFVTGLVSISTLIPFTGIVAVILGVVSLNRKTDDRGLSIAGIATGAIGAVISLIIFFYIMLIFLIALTSTGSSYYDDVPYDGPGYSVPESVDSFEI